MSFDRFRFRHALISLLIALLLVWLQSLNTSGRLLSDLVGSAREIMPNAISADQVVVGFSPGLGSTRAIDVVLGAIGEARLSIHMAAYTFTSQPIASALVAASRRGVDVRIVVDRRENSSRYTAATFTANEGIPTRIDGHYSIFHDKLMVIDGETVETGSFNYTANAVAHNAENAILLRHVPEVARAYEREWQRVLAESDPLQARL